MSEQTLQVVDEDAATGVLEQEPEHEQRPVAVIRLPDERRVEVDTRRLVRREEGGYRYRGRFADLEASEEVRVPLAHEEVNVSKTQREAARIRIRKHVETHTEEVEHELMREHVVVDRVPVDRPLDAPVDTRQEGDTLIIPVMEERVVVTKQLVLTEELHVRRTRETEHDRQEVTLWRTEAEVERIEDPPSNDARES